MPLNVSMKNESLYESSRQGDVERIRAFLESSSALNEPDPKTGMTLLHYACHGEQAKIVELLCMDPRQNINAQDNDGWTALHFAADRGSSEIVSNLIKIGANGTIADTFRKTPLHYVAGNGNYSVAQLMVTAFPQTRNMKSLSEKTPYDLALANHRDNVLGILDPR
ncbi:Ankyrin repeat containing protein [Perkinsela sp. CCAP 1560/4]|nr:Ankyrin repeat containing protein [Perkinsela sp. CCAP 1560/4]|eukprot:KNH08280.1 Ankyrin repeat containing protein [Perkinsela sp. CCAP 1560/4]